LLLPQELKALGGERQVLLYEGLAHPVLCDKIRYHRDAHFTARLLPAVRVPSVTA
jgi:type IV secretion system protein VirD4